VNASRELWPRVRCGLRRAMASGELVCQATEGVQRLARRMKETDR
jgi:hypothetical protein